METENVKGSDDSNRGQIFQMKWVQMFREKWEGRVLDPSEGHKALTLLAAFAQISCISDPAHHRMHKCRPSCLALPSPLPPRVLCDEQ